MNDANDKPDGFSERLGEANERWLEALGEESASAETESGIELKAMYTPLDAPQADYLEKLGFPGSFPSVSYTHLRAHET